MQKNLYIDASHPEETRIVLKSESNIEEYESENKNSLNLKSNIYLGKVGRVEPSLQAAFIDFGSEKHGFLPVKELAPSGKDICSKQLYSLIDKIVKVDVDENQIEPFLPTIYEKLQSLDREELIKHFVSAEINRFLAYYKNSRDINVSDKKGDRGDNDDWVNGRKKTKENFTRLFMNVGSKDNLNTQRLILSLIHI